MHIRIVWAAVKTCGQALFCALALSTPASAELDSLFQELLRNPDDPTLNIAFAREAEAQGERRHALAAYERAARAGAGSEAERGYARLKNLVSPPRTAVLVETGVSYFSNVRENPGSLRTPEDVTLDGGASLIDERTVGETRVRTLGDLFWRAHTQEDDLTQVAGGVWTGPVLTVTPRTELHVAAGGQADWLSTGRTALSGSLRGKVTTLYAGAPQWLDLRGGRRFVDDDGDIYSDSWFANATAQASATDLAAAGDTLFLRPRIRWSQADDDAFGRVFDKTRDAASYVDAGGRIAYFFPIVENSVFLGAGASAYQRWFEQNVAGSGADRRDLQWEATAHAVWRDPFDVNVDLRVDYRFENADSNDPSEDYTGHVVGVRTMWRF